MAYPISPFCRGRRTDCRLEILARRHASNLRENPEEFEIGIDFVVKQRYFTAVGSRAV